MANSRRGAVVGRYNLIERYDLLELRCAVPSVDQPPRAVRPRIRSIVPTPATKPPKWAYQAIPDAREPDSVAPLICVKIQNATKAPAGSVLREVG